MDPNTCWNNIVGEMNCIMPDWDNVNEYATSLQAWTRNGGFLPKALQDAGLRKDGVVRLCRMIANQARANTIHR